MSRVTDCPVAAGGVQQGLSLPSDVAGKELTQGVFQRTIDLWFERSRQRQELRELISSPEDTFRDLGLSRYDVQREAQKPFWRE